MSGNDNTFTLIVTKDKSIKVNGQTIAPADAQSKMLTVELSSEIPIIVKIKDSVINQGDDDQNFTVINITSGHQHTHGDSGGLGKTSPPFGPPPPPDYS